MAARPCSLSVENLESRLNLSSLGGVALPAYHDVPTRAQERSTMIEQKTVRSLSEYAAPAKSARKGKRAR